MKNVSQNLVKIILIFGLFLVFNNSELKSQNRQWAWYPKHLLNDNFYYVSNPDVKAAGMGANQHWSQYGVDEGRSASAALDPVFYRNLYPDLAAAFCGGCYRAITIHFVESGIAEHRIGSPVFDIIFYRDRYHPGLDLLDVIWNFKNFGMSEGKMGSPIFDPVFYMNTYADLRAAFGANNYEAAYVHYLKYGMGEGRKGAATFDVKTYLNKYPDLKAAFGNDYKRAILHYFQYGRNEGRTGI